jgi:3-phosphoshikimate 1-carboxyvinyltransferase
MHERPQAALFQALRQLGYRIDSPNLRLPALIHGAGARAAQCTVSIEESSQFASALLLGAKAGNWEVTVTGENAEESPYVAMTRQLIATFPHQGGPIRVEPDASSGSYFLAAGTYEFVSAQRFVIKGSTESGFVQSHQARLSVTVAHWPTSGWQMDAKFLEYLGGLLPFSGVLEAGSGKVVETVVESFEAAGVSQLLSPAGSVTPGNPAPSDPSAPLVISRRTDLGDSIMTAITLAPLAEHPIAFTDLARLRVQECERVAALRTELTKCAARVVEDGDRLTVFPSADQLHGAEIETYNDHRMAMCFAILGLKIAGIKIKNPACVKKTFPNFFQKLRAAPAHGLGATIRDLSGRTLEHDELFAD